MDVALGQSRIRKEVLQHIEPRRPEGDATRVLDVCFSLVEGRDIQLAMVAAETLRRIGKSPPAVREPTSGEPLMPKSIVERVFLLQTVQFFRALSVDGGTTERMDADSIEMIRHDDGRPKDG